MAHLFAPIDNPDRDRLLCYETLDEDPWNTLFPASPCGPTTTDYADSTIPMPSLDQTWFDWSVLGNAAGLDFDDSWTTLPILDLSVAAEKDVQQPVLKTKYVPSPDIIATVNGKMELLKAALDNILNISRENQKPYKDAILQLIDEIKAIECAESLARNSYCGWSRSIWIRTKVGRHTHATRVRWQTAEQWQNAVDSLLFEVDQNGHIWYNFSRNLVYRGRALGKRKQTYARRKPRHRNKK